MYREEVGLKLRNLSVRTLWMTPCRFSLTRIFPFEDRNVDIREKIYTGQRNPVFWHVLRTDCHFLEIYYLPLSEADLGLLQHPRWSSVIIVNGLEPLNIVTKSSTLDVAAVLDLPLAISSIIMLTRILFYKSYVVMNIYFLSSTSRKHNSFQGWTVLGKFSKSIITLWLQKGLSI